MLRESLINMKAPTDDYCQIPAEYVLDAAEISRRKPDANAGNPNIVKDPRI